MTPAPPAFAAETTATPPINLQITPTINKVTLYADEQTSHLFSVKNIGSEQLKFRVYAAPYTVSATDNTPDFTEITSSTEIADWISFTQTEYILDAGAEQIVEYRVKVPKTAPSGRQHAVIFAEGAAAADQTENSVRAISRVGLIFSGEVANGENPNKKTNPNRSWLIIYGGAFLIAIAATSAVIIRKNRRQTKQKIANQHNQQP
jgi:hypothetical protein